MADDQPTSPGAPGPESEQPASSADREAADREPDSEATRAIEPESNGADATAAEPGDPDATQASSQGDPGTMQRSSEVEADSTQLAPEIDSDATQAAPQIDPDATRLAPRIDADATQLAPAVDPFTPDDEDSDANAPTHVIRPPTPDPTAVMRPVPPTVRGSATVRPGGGQVSRTGQTEIWAPEPPPDRRAWWLPILLGIVGLLILVGVAYLLVHALSNNGPAQTPVTPAPVASTPTTVPTSTLPTTPSSAPPSAPPSSLAPSSLAPSSPPPSSGIVIPSTLTGLLFPDVEAELNAMGLKYKLAPQINNDPSVLPNTVLSLSPAAGSTVAPGTVVTVYYAEPSPSSSPSSPSP